MEVLFSEKRRSFWRTAVDEGGENFEGFFFLVGGKGLGLEGASVFVGKKEMGVGRVVMVGELEDFVFGESMRRLWESVSVAMVSSAVSVSVVQPIDVASRIARRSNGNILEAMAKVTNDAGVRGLFKGNKLQILRKVPTKAVRVMTYEWSNGLLQQFRSRSGGPSLPKMVENALVSTFAAAFSVAVTYPLHFLCVLKSKGLCMSKVKPRGFYRGITPLCIATIPAVAIELFAYNVMRDHNPGAETNLSVLIAMSLVARMAGQTLAQPFKVISKHMALSTTGGIRSAVGRIAQESGPLGFFNGMQYKYLKIVVSVIAARAIQKKLDPMQNNSKTDRNSKLFA